MSFSLWVRAFATGDAWSGSCLSLRYLDEGQELLGETRIAIGSRNCPWVSGPALHLVDAWSGEAWYDYTLNINEELLHLPSIDPAEVRYVTVSLHLQCLVC